MAELISLVLIGAWDWLDTENRKKCVRLYAAWL